MPRPVALDKMEFRKIAVIRLGKTDEVMQTIPMLGVLKKQYPQAQIHFVVKEEYADVLREVGEIYKIHSVKNKPFALFDTHDEVAKEFADLVIDLQNDFRSAFLYSAFAGAPKIMCKKYTWERFLQKMKVPQKYRVPPLWKRFLYALPRQDYELPSVYFA